MILLHQMLIFFIIMGVGLLCQKIHILDDNSISHVTKLVVNVANPCMIVSSVVATIDGPINASTGKTLLESIVIAFAIYAVMILISFPLNKILGVKIDESAIYTLMLIFSNTGFMGLPVLKAAYGDHAVLIGAFFLFPFNILMYTYGVSLVNKESTGENPLKKMINPGTVAVVIALILLLLGAKVPAVITDSLTAIGDLTAPLSMLVIGYSFSKIKLKELFTDVKLDIFLLIKLIFLPILGVLIFRAIGVKGMMLDVAYIMLTMPVASMVGMFAEEYNNHAELATKGIALSTLLSVATIPLVEIIMGI